MFGVQRQPRRKKEARSEREKSSSFLSFFLAPEKGLVFKPKYPAVFIPIFFPVYTFFFGIIYISVARVSEELGRQEVTR